MRKPYDTGYCEQVFGEDNPLTPTLTRVVKGVTRIGRAHTSPWAWVQRGVVPDGYEWWIASTVNHIIGPPFVLPRIWTEDFIAKPGHPYEDLVRALAMRMEYCREPEDLANFRLATVCLPIPPEPLWFWRLAMMKGRAGLIQGYDPEAAEHFRNLARILLQKRGGWGTKTLPFRAYMDAVTEAVTALGSGPGGRPPARGPSCEPRSGPPIPETEARLDPEG